MSALNERTVIASEERLPVLRPQLPTFERLEPYLRRIDRARVYTNRGPLVAEFESRVSGCLGVPGALVSANSGTTALIAAILASAGRATVERPYALMPAFTFVATALAAEACGYQPYLLDIEPADWQLAPDCTRAHPALERAGIVIVVSPFGRAVSQSRWTSFRERTGVPVVIDAAACFDLFAGAGDSTHDALGALPVTLSFHATKAFSTGEGGAVITTDERLLSRAGCTLNMGFSGSRECRAPAVNGKMSEYHAAVGLAELDGWVAKHRASMGVASRYRRAALCANIADALYTARTISGCYVLLAARTCEDARRAQATLDGAGIGTRYWYGTGLHHHAQFEHAPRDPLPATEYLSGRLLGLPFAPDLPDADIDVVVTLVSRALGY